jgi:transposase InsO family protein
MKTIMNIDDLKNIEDLGAFLSGSQAIAFIVVSNKAERYRFIKRLFSKFDYPKLKRKEKGVLRRFACKVSGYSRQQMSRLIKQYANTGELIAKHKTANGFERRYTGEDVKLLAQMDERHDTPSGPAVKKLCERAFELFCEVNYIRLAGISVSHLYNLRHSTGYQKQRRHFEKTHANKGSTIGERRKPTPNGEPGYIRIDTVHQGDLDGRKGVYHINAVDEVTQFEIVISVERISECYFIPVLKQLLKSFPFKIKGFHSDNGSEYINHIVAKLLKKLLIEFTKSRPRKSGDNALAEGKNAAVVRKTFGYAHIPQRYAAKINAFNIQALNPYVNYHRPCFFPTIVQDSKGKQKRIYNYNDMMTPYEKFKSLPDAAKYLKPELSFKKLDDLANSMSDNKAADLLQQRRKILFKHIYEDSKKQVCGA